MKTVVKYSLALLTIAGLFTACSDDQTPTQPPVTGSAQALQAYAQGNTSEDGDDEDVVVFQAAGPTVASIQGTVEAYRAALGDPNNGIAPGPLASGRREINWDGGGSATTITGTPLTNFLNARGALFTTTGTGFVQAPLSGLADTFHNPTYESIFQPFSPQRLFSAIDSNVHETQFFVPGSNGGTPATVRGFGAVFTDVDKRGKGNASTRIEYFDADGDLLFSRFVPALQGDGSLSFFGIVFDDARIFRVRITSGNVAPGPADGGRRDVVMMDDFLYGEPQAAF